MLYRQYGQTGKMVSVLGFGGMRFDTAKSREENADLVRYACSQGINYFDTAPNYCGDQSEDIFGLAFNAMPGPFYSSTKGMPVYCDTAEKAIESVKRSRDRLGVEKINFYHIWCVRKMEHYTLAMQPGGQYEGLLRCQEEGLIEHIVISSHQTGPEIRHVLQDGKVEGVLLGMNILNFPYRWDAVLAAQELGYGVVAMNPLAGGLIPKHEERLGFLAADGETPTEAALRFMLSCPQITVTLNGFTTREHVDMACRVVDRCVPFSGDDIARVREHLTGHMDAICTSCGYCDQCPEQIPIPAYMQFYNQRQMFGADAETMRRTLQGDHNWGILVDRKAEAAACVECRRCEEACTQHLDIIARLRQISEWEQQLQQGG